MTSSFLDWYSVETITEKPQLSVEKLVANASFRFHQKIQGELRSSTKASKSRDHQQATESFVDFVRLQQAFQLSLDEKTSEKDVQQKRRLSVSRERRLNSSKLR